MRPTIEDQHGRRMRLPGVLPMRDSTARRRVYVVGTQIAKATRPRRAKLKASGFNEKKEEGSKMSPAFQNNDQVKGEQNQVT